MPLSNPLFATKTKYYKLPNFETTKIDHANDEIELMGRPETMTVFEMLRMPFRGDIKS